MQLDGLNTTSNVLYVLNEEDSIGLKIDEHKRRRGESTTNGIMDIDMGLSVTGFKLCCNIHRLLFLMGIWQRLLKLSRLSL